MAVDTIDRLDLLLSQFAKPLGVFRAFGEGEVSNLGANLNEFSFKSIGSVEFFLVLVKSLSLKLVLHRAFKSIGEEGAVGDGVLVAVGMRIFVKVLDRIGRL